MRAGAQIALDLGVPPLTARHRPVKPQREGFAVVVVVAACVQSLVGGSNCMGS
ncbi:hypothetical protein [Azospirillum griseum]|uniref:hypothetical protein n=1 Tax=Azospirillum griseum TaxID=2496639 RepID=UPI001315463E|nr:hypothetical protein [Azospirillum griseum]